MKITMYVTTGCRFCQQAEELLRSRGVAELTRIAVDANAAARKAMVARSGRSSTPQIFIDEIHVGGYDDLKAFDAWGVLDTLLRQ